MVLDLTMNIEHHKQDFNRMIHLHLYSLRAIWINQLWKNLLAPSIWLVIIYFLNRTWNLKEYYIRGNYNQSNT